jgi:hypothetical protein
MVDLDFYQDLLSQLSEKSHKLLKSLAHKEKYECSPPERSGMPEKDELKVGINQFRAQESDLNTILFSNKIRKTKRGVL